LGIHHPSQWYKLSIFVVESYLSLTVSLSCKDQGQIDVWGYKPTWFDTLKSICKDKHIRTVCGDIHQVSIVDTSNTVSFVGDTAVYKDWKQHVKDVVYCRELDSFYVLDQDGSVSTFKDSQPILQKVVSMVASESHVLFHCASYAPVYAMGSNRFSQLGLDFHQELKVETPMMVEYFCGLGDVTALACGPFHSAVVMGGDVYTFGWSKDGRLGWGNQDEDSIALAVFLDVNEQPVEMNAVKVACGAAHTLVLDGK
jgi:alpha-tubulin suppressor-like RCC1 family protein